MVITLECHSVICTSKLAPGIYWRDRFWKNFTPSTAEGLAQLVLTSENHELLPFIFLNIFGWILREKLRSFLHLKAPVRSCRYETNLAPSIAMMASSVHIPLYWDTFRKGIEQERNPIGASVGSVSRRKKFVMVSDTVESIGGFFSTCSQMQISFTVTKLVVTVSLEGLVAFSQLRNTTTRCSWLYSFH